MQAKIVTLPGDGIGPEVVADGYVHQLDAEIMGCLVQRGMAGAGHHHLRGLDLGPVGAGPVARRLDRQQQALGASGGHGACHLLVTSQERGGHGHDLGLEFAQAGKGRRVEAVFGKEQRVGLLQKLLDLVAAVVDEAKDPPVTLSLIHI